MADNYISQVGNQEKIMTPVTTGGAGNANRIISTAANGYIDPSILPSTSSMSESVTATAAISANTAVNVYYAGSVKSVRPADNTAAGSEANAWASAAITNGAVGTVIVGQQIVTGMTGLIQDTKYYLGTAGTLVTTPPTASGNVVQAVGVALTTTEFFFNPSPNWKVWA